MKSTAALGSVLAVLAATVAHGSPTPGAPPAAKPAQAEALLAAAQAEANTNCGAAVDIAWQAAEHLWREHPTMTSGDFSAAATPIWSLLLRCASAAGRTPEAALAARMLQQPAPHAPSDLGPEIAALVAKHPLVDTTNEQAISLTMASTTEATCWVDGAYVGACPQTLLVNPGPHFVAAVPVAPPRLAAPGATVAAWGKSDARLVWLKAGESLVLAPSSTVVLLPPPPAEPQPSAPAPFLRSTAPPPKAASARRAHWWVYAAIGTAVAGAATAIILYETRDRTQTIEITSQRSGIPLHQW